MLTPNVHSKLTTQDVFEHKMIHNDSPWENTLEI